MANKKSLQMVLLVAVFACFTGLLILLNVFTAPLILANNQGAELEPLFGVMPEASGFEAVSIEGAPATVKAAYRETSGKGYVVRCATNKGYTGEFIELTMAVAADGKISGVNLDAYPETRDFGAEYPSTFVGQDSTLAGVDIVAGVTYSSSAFKGAVADAFQFLIDNGYISAGVKAADQIIGEMIPTVSSALRNPAGIAQVTKKSASNASVVEAYVANNGTVAAFWVNNGSDYLAIANAYKSAVVFDLDGNVVAASDVAEIAKTEAGKLLKATASKDQSKVKRNVPADATLEEVPMDGVLSTISSIFKATTADGEYYAFTSKSYGFSNEIMSIYVVIDANGAIYALNADELIIEAEYFSGYSLDAPVYKAGFVGKTAGDYEYQTAVVSGATLTSQAVHTAVVDAFDAYKIVKGGN